MLVKIMGALVSFGAAQWPGISFSYTKGGRTRKEKNVDGKRRQKGGREDGKVEGRRKVEEAKGKMMRTMGRKLQFCRSSQAGKHDQIL